MSLSNRIRSLLHLIWTLLVIIVQIVVIFILALVAGALYILRVALPYLLRAACIALFVFGWLQGVLGVYALYAEIADGVGALFVAAALGIALWGMR